MPTSSKHEQPPLLVRADAGTAIGTGHLMRCLALAEAWQDRGGRVAFLSWCSNPILRRRIESAGCAFTPIDAPHPEGGDMRTMLAALKRLSRETATPPWVILDGYHFDSGYLSRVRTAGGRLMVIDDTANLPYYDADIIVNHAWNAEQLTYGCSRDTVLLLGTRFALLRSEFQHWREHHRVVPDIARRVVVSLGGSDPDNVTLHVVRALQQIDMPDLEARIVVGPANPHRDELMFGVASSSRRLRVETDVTDLPSLMAWADLAVAAGGTTCWELAYMRVPALVFVLARNQAIVAEGLAEVGTACNLGDLKALSCNQIAEVLLELIHAPHRRQQMARMGRLLVDGKGVERIIAVMLRNANDSEFGLRRATENDAALLWRWANDPATRKNSFNPDPISWTAHDRWYTSKLVSPDTRIWLLEVRQVPVGQIRYERVSSTTAQISFSVAPAYRGRNFGTKLLQLSIGAAGQELGVQWLEGIAFTDNSASVGAFTKARFDLFDQKIIAGHHCFIFRKSCLPAGSAEPNVALY